MADAERWIAAAELASDVKAGSLVGAIKSAQDQISADRVSTDVVVSKLETLVSLDGPFEGTIMALYESLTSDDDALTRQVPKTPQHLSRHLTRIKPMLGQVGLHVEFGDRTNRGRIIRCWHEREVEPRPPKPRF